MRILLLALLLACGVPSVDGAGRACVDVEVAGYPEWLVVDVLEAACEASEYFGDMGVEVLWGYYQDGTLQISYQGRDAVNPAMGRYKVMYGGGIEIIVLEDNL